MVAYSGSPLLASVPLKYTYLVKNIDDVYLYESNTGLWRGIASENQLLRSLIPQRLHGNYQVIDNFNPLKSYLSSTFNERITVSESKANQYLLHLRIDAPAHESAVKEQLRLLQRYQKMDFKTILIDRSKFRGLFLNDSTNDLKPELKAQLFELAKYCNVEILISNRVEYFSLGMNNEASDELSNQNVYLYILGDSDDTTFAETRLRILMDTSLGLFVDSLDIPLSLIPLVGGMGFGNFKSIAKETGVNLYLPTVIPELFFTSQKRNLDILFISGMEAQVLLAKKLIIDVKEGTEKQILYKSIKVLKVKKDLILANRKYDLSSLMYKYGAFIQVPPLGFDDANVHFQACSEELIDLIIEDFNCLAHEIYEGEVWFHKGDAGSPLATLAPVLPKISYEDLREALCQISIAANVLIYAQPELGSYRITVLQDEAVKALELFKSSASQFYDQSQVRVRLNIELGLSYHEFISGKKNGKIVKITNSSACSLIDFLPLNEYSLILSLEAGDFKDFLNSFSQLQQEFPSEVKFYIPESFHRQIIGTGGALIQSIMRKYNVFVKFSNSYDQKNNLKSHVRYDNVIIRCPFKNSSNIPLVQNELNSLLINNENVTFFNTYLKISRNQHRLMNFDKIQEIEKKTSTFIKFPVTEPAGFAIAEVLGTETQSINATRLLISEMAESYEFRITHSETFHKIISDTSEVFVERIRVPFKLLYKFEVMTADKKSPESGSYHAIILSYPPECDMFLEDAITNLTAFLREFEFTILDRGELSNNDLIINGSASRFGVPGSVLAGNTARAQSSTAGNTTIPLQLPHAQQLYQLPRLNTQQRLLSSQPTMVQSFIAPPVTAKYQRHKRPSSNPGADRRQRHNTSGNGF